MTPLPEQAKPVHAQSHLSAAIRFRMCKWIPDVFGAAGFDYPDLDKLAHPKVSAIVAIYDDALARLKSKTGERAEAAREQIGAARAPIAAVLDLVNGIQADLNGPIGVELQARITATRAALAEALRAKELSPGAKIEPALIAVEKAWADIRELDRDLVSIYERLIVPPLPNLEDLRSAEASTKYLAHNANASRATIMHVALDQGRDATADEARLWICYEQPGAADDLFALRWERYMAAHPECGETAQAAE